MKKTFAVIGCLIMILAFSFADSAGAAGSVSVLASEGDVKVTPPGKGDAVACEAGMSLEEGTKLATGEGAYVDIAFDADKMNVIKVKEKTQVVVKLGKNDKLELIDGELFAVLQNLKKGETFRIKTPCATCGARGTAWHTKGNKEATDVSVIDDKVYVRGINRDGSVMEGELIVEEGYETHVDKFERPETAEKMTEERMAELKEQIGPMAAEEPPAETAVTEEVTEEVAEEVTEEITETGGEPEKTESAEEPAEVRQERADTVQEATQEIAEQRSEALEKKVEAREEQAEVVQEQKEEERLDQVEEKAEEITKDDGTSSSGSFGSGR